MKAKILQLIKDRDEQFLKKFCQPGAYMGPGGDTVHGVCRPIDISEYLSFAHVHDAIFLAALLEGE